MVGKPAPVVISGFSAGARASMLGAVGSGGTRLGTDSGMTGGGTNTREAFAVWDEHEVPAASARINSKLLLNIEHNLTGRPKTGALL